MNLLGSLISYGLFGAVFHEGDPAYEAVHDALANFLAQHEGLRNFLLVFNRTIPLPYWYSNLNRTRRLDDVDEMILILNNMRVSLIPLARETQSTSKALIFVAYLLKINARKTVVLRRLCH